MFQLARKEASEKMESLEPGLWPTRILPFLDLSVFEQAQYYVSTKKGFAYYH